MRLGNTDPLRRAPPKPSKCSMIPYARHKELENQKMGWLSTLRGIMKWDGGHFSVHIRETHGWGRIWHHSLKRSMKAPASRVSIWKESSIIWPNYSWRAEPFFSLPKKALYTNLLNSWAAWLCFTAPLWYRGKNSYCQLKVCSQAFWNIMLKILS